MWENRSRKKRGRPATGQGETLYIPVSDRASVAKIIGRDVPESGNIYISTDLLEQVRQIIQNP